MEKYETSCKDNKYKISAPTWNEVFELPVESYSASDVQDYFEYIFKRHEPVTHNLPIRIFINKIENRMTFKIVVGY